MKATDYRELYIVASDAQILAFHELLRFRCRYSLTQDTKAQYLAGMEACGFFGMSHEVAKNRGN